MYEVIREFSDHLNGLHKYKVGDTYAETKYESWTNFLLKEGFIKKVEIRRHEDVQQEQD